MNNLSMVDGSRLEAAFEDGGPIAIKAEPLDIPLKKPKLMSDVASLYHCSNNSSSSSSGSSRAQHYAAQQQLLVHPQSHLLHHHQQQQQTSAAFRPWTAQQKAQKYAQQQQQALLLQQIGPYANGTTTTIVNGTIRPTSPGGSILTLSQEPPLLQNPENVVPMSETDKFERSYQPNVALVPRKSILCGKEPSSVSVTPVQRRDYEGKDRSVIKCEVVQIKQESPATPPASATGGSPSADGTMRSVIKCDVQIKQERPGTPPTTGSGHLDHGGRGGRGDNSRSPGPPSSAHIPVSPPPPAGTSQKHALAQGAIAISTIIAKQQQPHHQLVSSMASYGGSNSNSPVPIPLDVPHSGSSGSNEITSSTSPLPPSSIVVNMNGTEGVVLGGEVGDKPKLVLIKEPISPSLSSRTPTGRHSPHGHMLQQQSGGSGHHSQSVSSPPPSHHSELHQPLYLHHHQVLQQQQQQQQQLFRSHLPGTTSTTTGGTIIHRNGHPIVGNSEFELSTDTDDDSQMGEPDSSNVPTTMELIGEMLKEVEPETKQQILNIFKVLLQESRVEHHRLQMEIRAKEDQLMEMQRHKMELQRQTDHFQQQIHQLQHELDRALLKIESLREHQHPLSQQHQQQQHHIMVRDTMGRVGESSTSSTPPSPLSLVSNGSNSNHSHQLIERRNSFPEKSEIIMKPLKKLLRRSPEDASTVLMLASPPSQSTGSLPPSLPACLSITATTVSVTPKASSTQADTEARREEGRRQHHSSISVSASQMVGGGVGGGGVLQSSPPPAPSQPQPISATNVPASPTTITAVSTVNGSVAATIAGTSTAPSITKPSSTVENGPSPSPIVVVIPVSSSVPLPNDAASSSSTPPSRAVTPVSPRCDARGRRTPADGKDNGDDCDEDEPMDEPAHALDSPTTADVKSDTSLEGMAKASITVTKGSAVGTVTSSSTSSGGASNQENDSPNRSKGESTSGNCTKNSCDN
uniref:Uncharacterized protein n=1 Tax=Anopheles christyi TaxID=43041 RepID=A0A182K8C2_9DIPT